MYKHRKQYNLGKISHRETTRAAFINVWPCSNVMVIECLIIGPFKMLVVNTSGQTNCNYFREAYSGMWYYLNISKVLK